ncbi:hypothetical protein MASR2M16_34800 [Thauera terpenica]|jgi:hypothetical protein
MDVSSIAAAASANASAEVQAEASVRVLKMAMDIQSESAMQLLQAIPAPPAAPVGSTTGGVIDTWV